MKIAYYSVTRQVARFVKKLNFPALEITATLTLSEPFILIIPTYEKEILQDVWDFMAENAQNCQAIIASGNRNFAELYIYSAKELSAAYQIPIVYDFEFNGTSEDVEKVKEIIESY
ncbi:protein NrdI [Lactococcus hodotermopsidis]|uniref:Protein NrdI n=1 Tax=Pseudolactococcus hodotermopsidis TaxID=2709157 RepID=A0A6A0BBZ0_9LACT|nr:class Ib ribonucleoside-diphosphate reductase assembly flavoprotein NrdI [Lactococcus hodotermopsidis]GFH41991.1 protein NrdI [Lactococcus hodotermopsidis]